MGLQECVVGRAPLTRKQRGAPLCLQQMEREPEVSETSFYRCKLSVVGFVGAKGADIIGEISVGAGNFCVLHDVVGIKELADSYKPEW